MPFRAERDVAAPLLSVNILIINQAGPVEFRIFVLQRVPIHFECADLPLDRLYVGRWPKTRAPALVNSDTRTRVGRQVSIENQVIVAIELLPLQRAPAPIGR